MGQLALLHSTSVTYPAEIRSLHLVARELTVADQRDLLAITSGPAVVRYLSFGPVNEAEARGLIDFATASAQADPRTDYALAIVTADLGAMIGSFGLQLDPEAPESAEVYFVFGQPSWGQGLATELLAALIAFGFERVGLRRIFGVAHPENIASVRVMERCGMAHEGSVHAAFEDESGWRDGIRYAILRA